MKITRILAAACFGLMATTKSFAYDESVSVTPTIQTASYSSGNALGGLSTVALFSQNSPFNGVLDAVWLAFKGGATAPVTFYIFDKLPVGTTCTDKTAFSLGAADVDKLAVAPFTLTPAATTGTTVTTAQIVQATSIRNKDAPSPTNNIYVCPVAGATFTPASTTDLVFKISGSLD